MRSVLLVLGFIAAASAISFSEVIKEEWDAFKLEYRKQYDCSTEERFRFKIFTENKYKIAEHNQLFSAGKVSYKMGLNEYSDMLLHEFTQTMTGYNYTARQLWRSSNPELTGATFISPANVQVPDTVDWCKNGAVTAVKDQGDYRSSWAFSSTGSLEGQHFRQSGTLVSLSEQNLVDCAGSYHVMDAAFLYIKDNGGIDTEKSYPYKGMKDSCHFDKSTIGATVKGFVDLPEGDEEKLKEAVATIGPISVGIDASHSSFKSYKEGVYDEPQCDAQRLHLAALVVGYGTENGKDYWLVKNAWGTTWGDQGYIKMSRNKNNQCGIATAASYPVV